MEDKKITKEYSNGEVTVVWKPDVCIHSAICFNGLPEVFDPRKRPWISIEGDETNAIVEQVKKCPSGAISYYLKGEQSEPTTVTNETIVEIAKDGPLMVYGNIKIKDADGNETLKHKVTALCRCGGSANKPYCDGTHKKIVFKG